MGVPEAAVVAVAGGQAPLDNARLSEWASDRGMGVTLFTSWESIVEQALFWAGDPKPAVAIRAVRFVHERLISVEATPMAVERWAQLTR